MSGLKRILGEESAVSVAHKKRKGRQRQQQLVERSCEECYTMFATYLEPWRSLHLAKTERYQLKISHMKIKATRQWRHPCPTCSLLLSILRGADGLILAQTDPSDLSLRYDENGVTDSDDLPDARFKAKRAKENVKTELRLSYAYGERKIRLDFLISLRSPFSTSLSDEIEVQEQLIVLNNVGGSPMNSANHSDPRLDYDGKLALMRRWLHPDWVPLVDLPATKEEETSPSSCTNLHGTRPPQKDDASLPHLVQHQQKSIPVFPLSTKIGPTRLLKLTDEGLVRLIECVEYFPTLAKPEVPLPNYVALSHCWGASQHLTATTSTLSALQAGILLNRLPQTFKDAIIMTKQLGFEYIWIDALCIIQDSAEDWLNESKRMGDIYMNATFTIAVHCAGDDSEGFLLNAMSKRHATTVRTHRREVGLCRSPNPDVDVTSSRLSKRGWVLQERFLSTRTLHFTHGQIYLETKDGISCEDGSLKGNPPRQKTIKELRRAGSSIFSPSALPMLRALFGLNHIPSKQTPSPIQRGTEDFSDTSLEWLDLIEMYSHCDLTKDTDKLVAISGMAQKIFTRSGRAWCAGIWQDHLCASLLWLPTRAGLIPPSRPRAPSWSWASWDGPIQFPLAVKALDESPFQPCCTYVSQQSVDGPREVTWLNGPGFLTLRGRLLQLGDFSISNDVMLGPGAPSRSGTILGGSSGLPFVALRNYVHVRMLVPIQIFANMPPKPPIGWVALDFTKGYLNYVNDEVRRLREHGRFLILGTYLHAEQGLSLFGIFLIPSDERRQLYMRVGAGQLSTQCLRTAAPEWDVLGRKKWEEEIFHDKNMTTVTIE